jgi:hypothetical protein
MKKKSVTWHKNILKKEQRKKRVRKCESKKKKKKTKWNSCIRSVKKNDKLKKNEIR